MYEKGKVSHIVIWRSFSDEVHGEKDIKMGKLFSAKPLNFIRNFNHWIKHILSRRRQRPNFTPQAITFFPAGE